MADGSRSARLETLEGRLLCARTPSTPTPATLGAAFDLGERKALLARMTNLPARTATVLAKYLKGKHAASFDSTLLSYMRSSMAGKFYFDPNDASSIASFVKGNLNTANQTKNANWVTDDRLFPKQSASQTYSVQLPSKIDWNDAKPGGGSDEFLATLNRQAWWVDLAQSYCYSGDAKYINELQYELASWSQQNQTFTPTPQHYAQYGLTMGIRVEYQMMAYMSVLDSSGWSAAANSLMLYKFVQQGDALMDTVKHFEKTDYSSNRVISAGKGLELIGDTLQEFDQARKYADTGRSVIYAGMDNQFFADGSHREQSPGYALNVLEDVLDTRQLDKVNGNDWDTPHQQVLENIVDTLWQELSPNSDRPAIGDTYRGYGGGAFLKAELVLGSNRWPANKASALEGWEFGVSAASQHLHSAGDSLGNRGATYSMPDSGNYVLRSGNDSAARQINYIAGPKGGAHGHFDYMSFELFGYGKPLIADPGPYQYDDSANRAWAVSAAAHNTISVSNTNPADLESPSSFLNSGISQVAGGSMLSSSYEGYNFLDGDPTLSRSIWYDGNNTMVIVDFASASAATNFETGFTLPTTNTSRDLAHGSIYTKDTGANVRIQSILGSGQTSGYKTKGVFTSDTADNNDDPATHFYTAQTGTFAVFATVITAYNGSANTAVNDVEWVTKPTKSGQVAVLNVNGTDITFQGPQFAQVGKNGRVRGTSNDLAYDSKGRLHMVYYDTATKTLKYAVRSTSGVWGTIQTVDGNPEAGVDPSLVIGSDSRPRVAYVDASSGDLKFAYMDSDNAWQVQTVDARVNTGNPSLVLSKSDGPIVAYYDRTDKDLRVATSVKGGWSITTVDSKGDVGRSPSLQLDPNRAGTAKYAVTYEDTSHGTFKYAIQYKSGYQIETFDGGTKAGGGYISMQFFDDGDDFEPAVSYYDAKNAQLKYAVRHAGKWSASTIATSRYSGQFSKLEIVAGQPRVLYYDAKQHKAFEMTGSRVVGPKWKTGTIATGGGSELHTAVYKGKVAFTSLGSDGVLSVGSA